MHLDIPIYHHWAKKAKKYLTSHKKEPVLKSKMHILLPIALALILPGLSMYAILRNLQSSTLLIQGLISGAIMIYILWYILWLLWDLKSGNNKLWFIFLVLLFGLIHWRGFQVKLPQELSDMRSNLSFRLIMGSILMLAIQSALRAQENISHLLLEKEQLQTENYKTQLKALRSQIDPHFLFNTLNTLRAMVRQQHPNSEKFVMSLSDFYRQTLKHNENPTLPLSEELVVLRSFLFVMKSRNEEAVSMDIQIDDKLHSKHLPSLALQTVVENCFKHNSMTTKMPLRISITSLEDRYIEVSNNIQPKIGETEASGLGLDLLQKRYELLNETQGVIIQHSPDQFTVKLKLL
ncbi:MAG: histidine kinase [Bacteroidota bacterium]